MIRIFRSLLALSVLLHFLFISLAAAGQAKENSSFSSFQHPGKIVVTSKRKIIVPPERFNFIKKKAIPFTKFNFKDFGLTSETESIKLKSGKKISTEKFLQEVNELEEKLNEWGYSLRDKQKVVRLGALKIPINLLRLQQKNFMHLSPLVTSPKLLSVKTISPCGFISPEEIAKAKEEGPPKEFSPFNWGTNWSTGTIGDKNAFAFEFYTDFYLKGEKQNKVNLNSLLKIAAYIFGERVELIEATSDLEKDPDFEVWVLNKRERIYSLNFPMTAKDKTTVIDKGISYGIPMDFPLGPIVVSGEFGFEGNVKLDLGAAYNLQELLVQGEIIPSLYASAFGKLGVGYEIASAGVEGDLVLIDDMLNLDGRLQYIIDGNRKPYFDAQAKGSNILKALNGTLSLYVEIDLLLYSKKFTLDLFSWEGINFADTLFQLETKAPAYKDRRLWLDITRISGITPYTARNERNGVIPKKFIVEVEAGDRAFTREIVDMNKDGVIDRVSAIEIPLLSSLRIPITIRVKEKYAVEGVDLESYLDLEKGEGKQIRICYDPKAKSFSGTVEGKEGQDVRVVGDTNYFGERFHSVSFQLLPTMPIKAAPAKAR